MKLCYDERQAIGVLGKYIDTILMILSVCISVYAWCYLKLFQKCGDNYDSHDRKIKYDNKYSIDILSELRYKDGKDYKIIGLRHGVWNVSCPLFVT